MSHNILNTAFTVQHIHSVVPFSQIAMFIYLYLYRYRYIQIYNHYYYHHEKPCYRKICSCQGTARLRIACDVIINSCTLHKACNFSPDLWDHVVRTSFGISLSIGVGYLYALAKFKLYMLSYQGVLHLASSLETSLFYGAR